MSFRAVQFPHLGNSGWILYVVILWNKLEGRIRVDAESFVDGIGIEDATILQGGFDVVCCGHNHSYNVEEIGNTLLINPGEMLGKDTQPAFAILDSSSRSVEKVEAGEQMKLGE